MQQVAVEKGFSYNFEYVNTIGKTGHSGNGNEEFNCPKDIIISKNRYLIVADLENERLQVFVENSPSNWEYFTTIKTPGVKPFSLELKETDNEESLWLLGDCNRVIYKYSNISQFISDAKNGNETKPEQFDGNTAKQHVCFQHAMSTDKLKGWSIRSEQYEHELEIYGTDMEIIFKFAKDLGAGQGNDQLFCPYGSCFDYQNGYFMVCDCQNHRVQIFK